MARASNPACGRCPFRAICRSCCCALMISTTWRRFINC
ncbi:hypothetical protein [Brenneria sp. L3-3C-1]